MNRGAQKQIWGFLVSAGNRGCFLSSSISDEGVHAPSRFRVHRFVDLTFQRIYREIFIPRWSQFGDGVNLELNSAYFVFSSCDLTVWVPHWVGTMGNVWVWFVNLETSPNNVLSSLITVRDCSCTIKFFGVSISRLHEDDTDQFVATRLRLDVFVPVQCTQNHAVMFYPGKPVMEMDNSDFPIPILTTRRLWQKPSKP